MDNTHEMAPYTSIDYYRDQLKMNEVTISSHQLTEDLKPQSHDNVTFLYVTSGAAQLEINGQLFTFKKGQLILLMSYHLFALKKLPGMTCEYHRCEFSIGLLLFANTSKLTYVNSLIELNRTVPLVTLDEAGQTEMLLICQKLMKPANEEQLWANDLRILSALTSVFYLFASGLSNRKNLDEPQGLNLAWKLLQYIHFYHQKDLKIDDLAVAFDLSKETVRYELKRLTHLTFAQNLNRVRIINATALLEFNALSINQIGRIVGFQTDANFYKEFKAIHQMTPKTYRQNLFPKHEQRVDQDSYDIYIYIYENYRQKLTIAAIAQALSLTTKHVSELVEQNFKMTVSDLIAQIRCSLASGLIQGTILTLNEISESVGFSDTKQFRQAFKKFYHMTPGEYRKKR